MDNKNENLIKFLSKASAGEISHFLQEKSEREIIELWKKAESMNLFVLKSIAEGVSASSLLKDLYKTSDLASLEKQWVFYQSGNDILKKEIESEGNLLNHLMRNGLNCFSQSLGEWSANGVVCLSIWASRQKKALIDRISKTSDEIALSHIKESISLLDSLTSQLNDELKKHPMWEELMKEFSE